MPNQEIRIICQKIICKYRCDSKGMRHNAGHFILFEIYYNDHMPHWFLQPYENVKQLQNEIYKALNQGIK